MDKEIAKVKLFLLMGLICLIVGFLICTKGPEYVFIGIIVLFASSCFFIVTLFLTIKICQLRKKQNEVKK